MPARTRTWLIPPVAVLLVFVTLSGCSKDEISVDTDSLSLLHSSTGLEWKVQDKGAYHSYRDPGARPPGEGWRLPTDTEILELHRALGRHLDKKKLHLFDDLGWGKGENARYLTSTTEKDDFEVFIMAFNFHTGKTVRIHTTDMTYTLWVREMRKEK